MSILYHGPLSTSSAYFPNGLSAPTSSSYSPTSSANHISLFPTLKVNNATFDGGSRPGAKNGECRLLGPFALFIQGALGALALLSLVYKRWQERPQRPVKIWAFDASKQVLGSALLHVANLVMSMLSSGELLVMTGNYQANPCSFYLLNLAIDTTIGIPILIVLLRLLTYGFSLTPLGQPPESIHSGNYGRPPKTKWWLKQSLVYFLGLLGMKFCVFLIFQICPWIIQVGDWGLRWTEGNETMQVFFVMLFFPVVMNAIQYYIIDSFIKDQKPPEHDALPSEDSAGDRNDAIGQRHSHDTEVHTENECEETAVKNGAVVKQTEERTESPEVEEQASQGGGRKPNNEYNPATDGEGSGRGGEALNGSH